MAVNGFATPRNSGFLLIDVIPILLLALPMTLIILTGEIDLSVASVAGFVSCVFGGDRAHRRLAISRARPGAA